MRKRQCRRRLFWAVVMAWLLISLAQPLCLAEKEARARLEGVVNLNTATVDQLTLLPRVGEKVASRIIEFRERHGDFKRLEDLMNVQGIGTQTFERLKPHLAVEGGTTLCHLEEK